MESAIESESQQQHLADDDTTAVLIELTSRRPIKNPYVTERQYRTPSLLDKTIVEETSADGSTISPAVTDSSPSTMSKPSTDSDVVTEDDLKEQRNVDVMQLVKFAKELISTNSDLERLLRERNDQLRDYQRRWGEVDADLETERQFFNDEITQIKDQYDGEFGVLESERQGMEKAKNEANAQCESLFAEMHGLRRRIRQLEQMESAKVNLQDKYDLLKAAYDELEKAAAVNNDKTRVRVSMGDELGDGWKTAQLEMEIDSLKETIEELETALTVEKARNGNLEAKLADFERKCDGMDDLETQLAELKSLVQLQRSDDNDKKRAMKGDTAATTPTDAGVVGPQCVAIADAGQQVALQEQLHRQRKKLNWAAREIQKLREENKKFAASKQHRKEKENGPSSTNSPKNVIRRSVSESNNQSPRPPLSASAIHNSPAAGHLLTSSNKRADPDTSGNKSNGRQGRFFAPPSSRK